MSLRASIQAALGDMETAGITARPIPYLLATFVLVVLVYSLGSKPKSDAPLLNPRRPFELTSERAKGIYYRECRSLLQNWFFSHPTEPAQLITDCGNMIVLPPSMANDIRSHAQLSFADFSAEFFQTEHPGFESIFQGTKDHLTLPVINKNLTKLLAKITKPLADETGLAVPASFGESKEWHSLPLRDTILKVIARISSRVFLGEELCRNEAWLKISREYAMTMFPAADALRIYPAGIIRSIAARVVPICRVAQSQVAEARSVLQPVLDKRAAAKAAATAEGKTVEFDDAIEWFENAAAKLNLKADYEPAAMQLFLSVVAVHTTSDLMTQTMTDLAGHPEVIEDLRKEIKEVLSDGGWKKSSLTNMKLLDSVIKESQRIKPIQLSLMQRKARANVKLSNGTVVPKGTILGVSTHRHWDDEVYPNANEWDGYRFYNMRLSGEPGKENGSQLVSTSPDHLGFGHGTHACPGRFFAANEIKIALIFILLNYDWKLPQGVKPKIAEFGIVLNADVTVEMLVRKREDDFDLSRIE
ncbi:cytochrome P450 [Diaporthe sp. PMI_573]|nr:cytochrome P450 [Diaporthaceae sp. PMI_573]